MQQFIRNLYLKLRLIIVRTVWQIRHESCQHFRFYLKLESDYHLYSSSYKLENWKMEPESRMDQLFCIRLRRGFNHLSLLVDKSLE
ncbi:hypothetical protein O3M35_002515 [Rhynocoris fuscipes]|uniref:Maturase K n=1 Tax=Rhynocoris fuscipes TaxID=488301 RepID=A0AAW1CT95_9HEMI